VISGRRSNATSAASMPAVIIRCGRRLDRMHDAGILEEHRVGVGPADIDADPQRLS
jgi:hypothetical protein